MELPEKIIMELTSTSVLTRWPCTVCGGCTEKVETLCEWPAGPEASIRVCEMCLRDGQDAINERLKGTELEGRLVVPSYEK
jgi:hypothetical protein